MVGSRGQNAAYGLAGWLYGSGVACTRGTEIVDEAAPESVLFCKKQKVRERPAAFVSGSSPLNITTIQDKNSPPCGPQPRLKKRLPVKMAPRDRHLRVLEPNVAPLTLGLCRARAYGIYTATAIRSPSFCDVHGGQCFVRGRVGRGRPDARGNSGFAAPGPHAAAERSGKDGHGETHEELTAKIQRLLSWIMRERTLT